MLAEHEWGKGYCGGRSSSAEVEYGALRLDGPQLCLIVWSSFLSRFPACQGDAEKVVTKFGEPTIACRASRAACGRC